MALPKLRSFKKNQKGFISIVALGIFALLVVFGMIVQESTGDSVESIKNTSKYYEAQDIADSVMEYLQYTMKDMEAGFSIVKETCSYSGGEYVGDGGGAGKMLNFEDWIEKWCPNEYGPNGNGSDIYAYSGCYQTVNSQFGTGCDPGDNIQCLQKWLQANPQDADDTVGENNPVVTPQACSDVKNSLATLIAGKNVEITVNVEGKSELDDVLEGCGDIDNGLDNTCYSVPIPGEGTAGKNCTVSSTDTEDPCNWNKLEFGSSSSDRVSIPFYYVGETGDIVNPYFQEQPGPPGRFVLRMRTPCKDGSNWCQDNERYWISEPSEGAVVQWQIEAECDNNNCGLIPFKGVNDLQSSIIDAGKINTNGEESFSVLRYFSRAINTSNYQGSESYIHEALKAMKTPVFTLYISGKMKTYNDQNKEINIPYLEYQLLTDRQIGSPTTKMEVIVSVDGNTYKKVLYQQEQKELVDFAIQN